MTDHIQNCHVDYLAFTIKAQEAGEGASLEMQLDHALWLIREIFGPIEVEDTGKGFRGYLHCFRFAGKAIVAFGGDLNKQTIHFDIPGESCALIANWEKLADFLDDYPAKLTRCDLAHDDYEGETLSIDWARTQYAQGGFKPARGLSPKSRLVSDEGHGTGSTYYVGSRESGKLLRIYEKGKELGDIFSHWVRFEVEWRSVHRELSTDMLRDPSAYLAGSYPCAGFISGRLQTIKTVAFKAAATIEKAVDHALKQAGGVIAALKELGHSTEEILNRIAKPVPSPRLRVNVQLLKAYRSEEKPIRAPAWWKAPTKEDADRTAAMLRLDFAFWKAKWSSFQPQMNGA